MANPTTMKYDGILSNVSPDPIVAAGKLEKLGTAATLSRGTILGKKSNNKLVVLGSDVTSGTFSGTGDGTKTKFDIVSGGVIPAGVSEVKVNGTATTAYTYNAQIGELQFTTAPANAATIAVKTVLQDAKPYAILAEDTAVGTAADVNAPIYLTGSFDPAKLTVANGYVVSEADKDALRNAGIILKPVL